MKATEFINFLSQYKNKILHIALFLFALNIAYRIYGSSVKDIALLTEQKETELKKNEALKDIKASQDTLSSISSIINKKDISSFMDKVGTLAKDSSVKILALKPQQPKEYANHTQYSFEINVSSDSYHNFGNFIKKVEELPDFYQVDSCIIRAPMLLDSDKTVLNIDLKLSTVIIK